MGSQCPCHELDPAEPVIYLAWTCDVPVMDPSYTRADKRHLRLVLGGASITTTRIGTRHCYRTRPPVVRIRPAEVNGMYVLRRDRSAA